MTLNNLRVIESQLWIPENIHSSSPHSIMLKYCQIISPQKIRIYSYFLFLCILFNLATSYLKSILSTVIIFFTGFLLTCLHDHFSTLPAAKQTILVHSTRLVILTSYLPLLRYLLSVWLQPHVHLIESWAQENFFLFCTMVNMNVVAMPLFSALILQLVFKMYLIMDPAKFLNLNTYRIKAVSTCIVFSTLLYQVGHAWAKGGLCSRFGVKQIQEGLQMNITIPSTEELNSHKQIPIIFILLVVMLLCEVASRVLVKSRKGSNTNQVSQQVNMARHGNSVSVEPSRIIENPVQSNVEPVSERIAEESLGTFVELKYSMENETISRRKQHTNRNELSLAVPSTSTSNFITIPRFHENVALSEGKEVSP